MSEPTPEFDTVPPELDQEASAGVQDPPRRLGGILMQMGPGLIIAGSIVGSGELIATTKTGAQAGITLLWLIVLGCIVKVFVQIELGRHTLTHGQTTLDALNRIPGKIGPANIILWWWLAMMLAGIAQLGGIVGGVGQSMAIAVPITGDYRSAIEIPSENEIAWFLQWDADLSGEREKFQELSEAHQQRTLIGHQRLKEQLEAAGERGVLAQEIVRTKNKAEADKLFRSWTYDDRLWALVMTIATIGMLYNGRYNIVQNLSTIFVVAFTFITLGNAFALQMTEKWSLSLGEIAEGFRFRLPAGDDGWTSLKTALATFGIIGVGATELITYPYWCLEKGYARHTGKRTEEESWAVRARGWIRIMRWDAFLSMVIYTLATMAFYYIGVAVLHREGRDPEGMRMVSTLASAYVPIFGTYAKWLFLVGAFAVLYSTFLIANAGHARLFTDGLKVFGLLNRNSQKVHNRSVSTLGVILPLLCLAMFWSGMDPVQAVLVSGVMQATMLPMLGFATLYFRKYGSDPRLSQGKVWDIAVVLSVIALFITGIWGAVSYFI